MGISSEAYNNKVRPQNVFFPDVKIQRPLSVLLIGNGFDLDLGMKTSYKDFANSKLWPFNSPIYGKGLGEFLNKIKETERWLDLENELANYAKTVSSDNLSNEQLIRFDNEDFNLLVSKLKMYLQSEQQDLHKNAHECKAKYILSEFSKKGNYFIHSFNYTSIYYIAQELGIRLDKGRIEYIHGTLEHNDLILGTGENKNLPDEYDWLYKTFNKNYSSNNLADSLANADEICIFGHSLGENDFDYFKPFFQKISQHTDLTYHNQMTDRRLKLTIYTKNEESEIDLKRKISKLTDNHLLDLYTNCYLKIKYTKQ